MNIHYIAGFFDADGYITVVKKNKNVEPIPYMGFTNTVKSLLEEIQEFIESEFGIKGIITTKNPRKLNHSIGYDLKYQGFNKCIELSKVIPIQHPKKRKRLSLLLEIKELTPANGKYDADTLLLRRRKCEELIAVK